MLAPNDQLLAALGPLAPFFIDPDVSAILVDSPDPVGNPPEGGLVMVERAGRLELSGVHFDSAEAILALIGALLALNGETLQPGATILPIRFPGSLARGMALLPPTAVHGPCLSIHKLMNTAWISWEKLIEWGSITPEALAFLQRAVCAPASILIAGGTNSGKTTLANRIAELIPPEKRLVIIEAVRELQIRHPRALYLEAGSQPGVSLPDLITTGARMRPDWLIFSELCGPEAMRAVELLSQGYSGMATIHSNSLEDALQRLETACLTAQMGLGLAEIRPLIASAFQYVCYQKLLPNGQRKIVAIAEIRGVEHGQYVLEPIFHF